MPEPEIPSQIYILIRLGQALTNIISSHSRHALREVLGVRYWVVGVD